VALEKYAKNTFENSKMVHTRVTLKYTMNSIVDCRTENRQLHP
jgi:hypothetical protein